MNSDDEFERESLRRRAARHADHPAHLLQVRAGQISRLMAEYDRLRSIEQRARDITKYSAGGRTATQAAYYILGEA